MMRYFRGNKGISPRAIGVNDQRALPRSPILSLALFSLGDFPAPLPQNDFAIKIALPFRAGMIPCRYEVESFNTTCMAKLWSTFVFFWNRYSIKQFDSFNSSSGSILSSSYKESSYHFFPISSSSRRRHSAASIDLMIP